jgi:hypothetical protein
MEEALGSEAAARGEGTVVPDMDMVLMVDVVSA